MKNGQICEEFARIFVLAPELALSALQEALKGKYEVTFKKVVPHVAEHPDPYQFPMATAGKEVATV